jgi:hypothetical protein
MSVNEFLMTRRCERDRDEIVVKTSRILFDNQ